MRLFIAFKITLSPEYDSLLAELRKHTAYDQITWVKKELQHITLRFLGKTPSSQLPALKELVQRIANQTPAFELEVERLGVFGSHYAPKVINLFLKKNETLQQLFQQMEDGLQQLGFEANKGNFVPHITLGRIRKINDKKRFWNAIEKLQPSYKQTFHISEIIMFRSQLEKEGPIYTELQRAKCRVQSDWAL